MDPQERRKALIRLRAEIRDSIRYGEPLPQAVLVDENAEEDEPLDLCDIMDLLGGE